MEIKLKLNEQQIDIVLGGLEQLKEQLVSTGYFQEAAPVQELVTEIVSKINQAESGSSCCGGCH